MKEMQILELLSLLEKLKCNIRHSWTSTGRSESVAEHSWRLAVFAYLIRGEFPKIDIYKLIVMCLVHDWGEAITGDIPTFIKTDEDCKAEKEAIKKILNYLSHDESCELSNIFTELEELSSKEAKICLALDKLECILQHNEANLATWLPLEYELQLKSGNDEVQFSSFLSNLRQILSENTKLKIQQANIAIKKI